MKHKNSDYIDYFILSTPFFPFMIQLLYNVIKGEKLMNEWYAMIGAIIAAIIAALVVIWRENKNNKGILEKVEERHTLEKAAKYHDITMSKLDYSKEILKDSKYKIEMVSDRLIEANAEIEKVSGSFSLYMQNIMSASKSKNEVLDALGIVESVVQENGILHSRNDQLIEKAQQLEIDNSRLVMENEKLISKVRQLQRENRQTKNDFDLEL